MFIALLFLPLMRWLNKKKVSKPISIFIVALIILVVLKIGGGLIQLSSQELLSSDNQFLKKAETKLELLFIGLEEDFGIPYSQDKNILNNIFPQESMMKNFGTTLDFLGNTITMILMTVFFVVLWLAESINFQKLMHNTILRQRHTSVKTFVKIERDLIKFIKVKFLVSLFTGVGIGLACVFFDVSFPIFWGLFAFAINFVQMVGSFVSVILLSIFAFVELETTSTLLFFILSISGVQVLFGSILEPVFMGKSFSINIITVLVMLMLWGYIWGVPGLIMAIPLTVFIKIILEQFPQTRMIANLISGNGANVQIPKSKNNRNR